MNFSRRQEQAERAARRLLWLFGVATVTVVLAVNLFAALTWNLLFGWGTPYPGHFFLTNTLVVGGLIVGGSWLETTRLREGGAVIAERLGAIPVEASDHPLHRRLRNIVEELSIAARIGVPRAFVISDEPSINALAAGLERNESVVIVTQGALQCLTRDELQGVVAHELSHIVNGDVGLNTRLVGLNYGLELVSLFGRSMLSQVHLQRASDRTSSPMMFAAGLLLVAGATLTVVGAIGEFAARVIRAGIGRQREFHADAQAVAFTRNRDGLGGALRKVAGQVREAARAGIGPEWVELTPEGGEASLRDAAVLRHPYWENVCHLLLIDPAHRSRWMATHPSLDDRIRRLYGRRRAPLDAQVINGEDEPSLPALGFALSSQPLRGEDDMAIAWAAPGATAQPTQPSLRSAAPTTAVRAPATADAVVGSDAAVRSDAVVGSDGVVGSDAAFGSPHAGGRPGPNSGYRLGTDSPPAVRLVEATRDAASAAALVIALLRHAPAAGSPGWPDSWRAVAHRVEPLLAALRDMAPASLQSLRWPLMELAAGRLRLIEERARIDLIAMAREIVVADGRITLQEWIFFSLLRIRLAPPRRASLLASTEPIAPDAQSVRLLFNLLAHCSQLTEVRADRAANAAIRALDLEAIGGSAGEFTLETLGRAIDRLDALPPLAKPLLVRHLVAMLPQDAAEEVRDFVRLLCVAIDCPAPRLPPRTERHEADNPAADRANGLRPDHDRATDDWTSARATDARQTAGRADGVAASEHRMTA